MLPDFDHLIRVYGGLAIFLGAALEGEAAVTTGGFLAHRGMVDPYLAALCAFAGSLGADQIVFFLARYHRDNRFIVRARQRPAFARAIDFIERRPMLFCIAFRFIYGMRIAGPIAIGVSQVPARQFIALNVLSAAVWATIFTFIGYRFGNAFEKLFARITSDPRAIAGAVAVILMLIVLVVVHHRKRSRRDAQPT